jgi:hypothetical protein
MSERCHFCHRESANRIALCMSTRDMEDRAGGGDAVCYAALADAGGGEKGMAYVDANLRTVPDLLDPTGAASRAHVALTRIWAEVGKPDEFLDETVKLKVGDVWAILAELERLQTVTGLLWKVHDHVVAERARARSNP